MLKNAFIDWLTITQNHESSTSQRLPIVNTGVLVEYNAQGLPVFERYRPRQVLGSFDSSIRVSCNGNRVSLSGNIGRFSREDNLFGFGFTETIERANLLLATFDLPPFTGSEQISINEKRQGAIVSRLDFTVNYGTGSEHQARSAIRAISNITVSRVKKGNAGDESYWFANTRWMFKAYIKHLEMLKHGIAKDNQAYLFALENGILRLELELKKRLLSELNMNKLENITDEKLIDLFEQQTEFCRRYQRTNIEDVIEHLPTKSRIYAEAWFKGVDLKQTLSNGTLYRHAKILRDYNIDILAERNIDNFPVQVRFVDLQPIAVPDWYQHTADELIKKVA